MRRKTVGKMYFAGKVHVTDPCYNEDVWCRSSVDVKEGEYTCIVWKNTDKYESCGEMVSDTRIGVIGIYLGGAVPPQKSMEEIATIGVDAGLAGFFMKKPDYSDSEWGQFCDMICKKTNGKMNDFWIFDEVINTIGFFSSSGYGDGVYPVYVARNPDGEIYGVEIRFI